jgi:hypothetical protein
MRRWLGFLVILGMALCSSAAPLAAQEDAATEPAFSNQLLSTLGLPQITLRQSPDGTVEGVQSELAAGRYLVNLTSAGELSSWANFVQIPAQLNGQQAIELLLETARDDVPHDGFVYGGGSYAVPNSSVSFVVELAPGTWHLAISRQAGPQAEEVMQLFPLAVAGESTATPFVSDIPSTVMLQLQDTSFGGLESPIAAGPAIWEVRNLGEQPRQVVLWRTPRPVTGDEYITMLTGLMSGTPTPAGSLAPTDLTWVGYVAILSPGRTMWTEFDFAPGNYLAVSYVLDPVTGTPAFLQGMIQPFTVADGAATPIASPTS